MKNITNQYKDLKEGKISQANFMRNLRMTFPHLVTNVTSFDDSIKILKNKGLLNEDLYGQQIAGNLEKERASREAFRSSAFNQGVKAHKNNVPVEENPFDEMSSEGQEWLDGWMSYGEKMDQMYANADLDFDEPVFENLEGYNDIEQAIMNLEMEKNNLLNADPRDQDPEIISDKIDDINAEIERLKNKSRNYGLESIRTGLDEIEKINPKQLKMGIKIEKEHTKNTKKAKKIATDHLKEKPDYYTRLKKAGLEEIKGGSGKEQYSNFNEVDNLNGQEVLIGIDCEIQMDPELSKEEATKIVVKNLKKNPYYYTDYKLAGKEAKTEPLYKYKEGSDQMKPVKGEGTFVDKDNGMKAPKGVEKVKASAARANKETNKGVKGVQEMTHNAKSSRGVKKMAPTGGKMKKVKIREALKSLIKQVITEEFQKKTISPKEQQIVDNLLNLNEGFGDVIKKVKDYAKKGLMTTGIVAALVASPQFSQAEKIQIQKAANIEINIGGEKDVKSMSNQEAFDMVYNIIKQNPKGVENALSSYKAVTKEDKVDVEMLQQLIKDKELAKEVNYMGGRIKEVNPKIIQTVLSQAIKK